MISAKTSQAVARAIGAIDTGTTQARIAEIEGERAECETAIERANERIRAIQFRLDEAAPIDGAGVADCLLAGDVGRTAATAGPDRDALQAEARALRAGIGDLNRRMDTGTQEVRNARDDIRAEASRAVLPLVAEIELAAVSASQQLAAAFAALTAVHRLTSSGEALRIRLPVEMAVSQLAGPDGILPRGDGIPVPGDVIAALSTLSGLGGLHRDRPPASVPTPQRF